MKEKISSILPRNDKVKYIREKDNLYLGEKAILEKNEILKYLTSFQLCCATTGRVYDNIKNKNVDEWTKYW